MSTLDVKPIKGRTLNTKLLTIAAVLLMVLALLFLATPLLRLNSGFQGSGNFTPPVNGITPPGGQNGVPSQGFQGPGPGGSSNPARQFGERGGGLLGFGLLSGITGTIVYAIALLISLAAAVGMFITRRWGQVLGILMAVIYILLGLVSFIPTLLTGFLRGFNGLSLGLSILHVALAIAVIVLASIPGKQAMVSASPVTPPAVGG
jgi:ABC-type glycerol-3-phosphate transport system permease component